ncbi:hypothetical protein GCM10027059_26870 [Myceligenerans halotolerans]
MSRTKIITDPDEIAKGPRLGDIVTERVDAVGPVTDGGSWGGTIVRIEREVPDSTTLTVPFGPKMLRETLCAAQAGIRRSDVQPDRADEHVARLEQLIAECDRHRPLGPDGKHGQLHTATCGCDDVPERYRPEAPEWKPGTVGTAETPDGPGRRVMRTEPRDLDAGDPRRGFIRTVWVDAHGTWLTDGEVDSFAPDGAEALRTEAARLGAAFDDLTERWKVQNSDLARLRRELEAEQRGRNTLAAGLEAERDEAREFLDHLGFWLVAETRREPVTREQAVKYAIAEIEELQAEVNRLNGLIQSDAETSRKALTEVERLRAARTLPMRVQVAEALAGHMTMTVTDMHRCACHAPLAPSVDPHMAEQAHLTHVAEVVLALFEQGGAAPKVAREQAAEVLYLNECDHAWSEANEQDWGVYMNAAAVVIARMGGAE